ncbi:MAG: hypothetical protein IIX11_03650 [Selenomonadales bacterium]|nr:hypothetical protein [Selenomonadales bacterium]
MIGTTFCKNNLDDSAYTLAALWCNENRATIEDKGDYYEVVSLPLPTLAEQKEKALDLARETFAIRRDAVRWVDGYGYDCATEDITNFMAAYTPLLVAGTGSVRYKVHLPNGDKTIVTLTADTMTHVYNTVRASQFEAYAWYEDLRARLEDAQTEEELTALLAEAGITDVDGDMTNGLGEAPAESAS